MSILSAGMPQGDLISRVMPKILNGKRALVLGVANEHSIAYGCARVFRQLGADLALTYRNEKERPAVEFLARELRAEIFAPCDVGRDSELDHVFYRIRQSWGSLDVALHSIALAPKEDLEGRLLDCSDQGFKTAMDVCCHSFIRMARLAEPLMPKGGTLLAMSYSGANRVVPHSNLMGPVKAALESAVRYLAYELGDKGIRVHAVSPGPLNTVAGAGLQDVDVLLSEAPERQPVYPLIDVDDVGLTAAYLATPFARRLTGTITYVDDGLNTLA